MLGQAQKSSLVDTMEFTQFPQDDFIGFYAGLDADGKYIKTLGALSDTCALKTAANDILDRIGKPGDPFQKVNTQQTKQPAQTTTQPS